MVAVIDRSEFKLDHYFHRYLIAMNDGAVCNVIRLKGYYIGVGRGGGAMI